MCTMKWYTVIDQYKNSSKGPDGMELTTLRYSVFS